MTPDQIRDRLASFGIDLPTPELATVVRLSEMLSVPVAALATADVARFPFEPVDPSQAPER